MRSFCTDHAIGCGEPLTGTAALAERHLFLRWPKGNWRRPRFETVGLSDTLRAAMKAASGGGRYVGLVDGDALELLSFPDGTRVIPRDQDHAAELVALWREGAGLGGTPLRRTILCCTDAKTDACCARYGFPVFKALVAAAPAFDIDVLQCTHIGGCHFAPSVIVMPDRQRYGRLTPAGVPDFLALIARNEIYLPAYKGNPALDELQQSAEAAALHWADGQVPVETITIGAVEMHSESAATVQVHLDAVTLLVKARRQSFPVYGNCRDMDADPKQKDRWVSSIS
ncbi:MAG: sucrase ferredoxin [Candidatus Devosia phytovorans]|uniref:Sucrase ferredoxin n=1 Tax=Candidatus Devosia phytovorans TaxID=3121372 RepID=A0AAJ5VRQ6_9HYPH|nr:sucrase ferredoxin [Devosia sp.]WEK02920.1 MAG: sucrase ferredoxin [Devosia sp.]